MTILAIKTAAVAAMLGNPDDIDLSVIEEIVGEAMRGELNEFAGDFRRFGETTPRTIQVAIWKDAAYPDVAHFIHDEAMRRMS